jgi:hypothetical protein
MYETASIRGWGADAALENRPGVPAEMDPPRPLGNMSLGFPARQMGGDPAVSSPQRPLTPVFATALPPRGLSGVLRRVAYRIPDYAPRRWYILALADRIDVVEHNVGPAAVFAGAVLGLLGLAALAARGARTRRRWWP